MVVGGSALPGVRVELNPTQLTNYGLGLEDVRNTLSHANANSPKGRTFRRHAELDAGRLPINC